MDKRIKVKLFLIRIRKGEMTVEDVPIKWREEVRKEIERQKEEKTHDPN